MSNGTWEEAVYVLIDGEPVTVTTTLEAADSLFRGWPGGTGPAYDATIQAFASVFDELEPADTARSAFLDAVVQTENGMTCVNQAPHLDGIPRSDPGRSKIFPH